MYLCSMGLVCWKSAAPRSRVIYRLISLFSAYEHRFDSFTDWVSLVTIRTNPWCWSISLFWHGYLVTVVNRRVWVFSTLICLCFICLKLPTLIMFLYFSRACHSLWIYWTVTVMRNWRTQQRSASFSFGGGIQTVLNSFLCPTIAR